ncbi:MAG: hypothetical protein U9N73_10430 [Candidatus Auribacterota bacterium]|nr:hypothetical protein [Candidatus Auribacterota bacterium]
METVLSFALAWLSTLSGVALGGFLVYRTKRENYDQLFPQQPKSEGFNLNSGLEFESLLNSKSTAGIPPSHTADDQFTEQFAESLAEKARTSQK